MSAAIPASGGTATPKATDLWRSIVVVSRIAAEDSVDDEEPGFQSEARYGYETASEKGKQRGQNGNRRERTLGSQASHYQLNPNLRDGQPKPRIRRCRSRRHRVFSNIARWAL